MVNNTIPNNPDYSRSPGQRPAWCQQNEPEDIGTDNRTGAAVFTWSREFGPRHLGAALAAEDHLGTNDAEAHDTRVRVYHPENRGMSLDEAEQLALNIIEAIKVARESEAQR